jgi:RNA polymerase sigma-70 factor (ECF subfamily)
MQRRHHLNVDRTPGTALEGEATQLLRQAKAGSKEAFAELVRLHHRAVRVFLSRFTRADDVIDDLAQEVFVSAYRGLGEHRDTISLLPWLLGIARNRALHYLRGEVRRQRREGRMLEAALAGWRLQRAEGDPEPKPVEAQLRALRDCLRALPARSLRLIKAFYFQNQSAETIAGRLGKRGGAVRMMLLRIRSLLGECIQGKLPGKGQS